MIHKVEKNADGTRHCATCGRAWKHPESRIQSMCSGVPFYTKENRPAGLLSIYELELRGLQPKDPKVFNAVLDHRQSLNGWKKLYKLEEAVPIGATNAKKDLGEYNDE